MRFGSRDLLLLKTCTRNSTDLDSTQLKPAVTGKHVHVRPETTAPASRAPSDEAAGYGQHPRYHR